MTKKFVRGHKTNFLNGCSEEIGKTVLKVKKLLLSGFGKDLSGKVTTNEICVPFWEL